MIRAPEDKTTSTSYIIDKNKVEGTRILKLCKLKDYGPKKSSKKSKIVKKFVKKFIKKFGKKSVKNI
jgi:hypothetical protein